MTFQEGSPERKPRPELVGWEGRVKVINECEVERYTGRGWVVLEVYTLTTSEEVYGKAPRVVPESSSSSFGCDGTVETIQHLQTSSLRFVVGLSMNKTLAEKDERISELEASLVQVKEDLRVASEEHNHRKAALDKAHDRVNNLNKALVDARTLEGEARERSARMEADLAKLRMAIGNLKFNEIVGQDQ